MTRRPALAARAPAAAARRRQPMPPRARMGWRKRLAVLGAAIAVPAMAAPTLSGTGLASLPGPAVEGQASLTLRAAAEAALPFERPGMSFPGSAYFYMADPPGSALVALPAEDPRASGGEGGRDLGALIDVGDPARPFFSPGVGITHGRALECLAEAVWYEAASESEAGQRAVAQVVLNRVAHPAWPSSVCGVVYQGSERASGCQFTFTCDGSLARRPGGASWAQARRIAAEALAGSVYAPIGLATHYHTLWVSPPWAAGLEHIGTIGAHRFYRNRGASGKAAAFRAAYAGIEPVVSGRTAPVALPPAAAAGLASAVPVAAPLGDRPSLASQPTAASAPAPTLAASPAARLAEPASGAGSVRPEYARAGQWKANPGPRPAPGAPAGAASGE
ncbi:MAG: cell wall hydrolase [Erythrobacter cryptus]